MAKATYAKATWWVRPFALGVKNRTILSGEKSRFTEFDLFEGYVEMSQNHGCSKNLDSNLVDTMYIYIYVVSCRFHRFLLTSTTDGSQTLSCDPFFCIHAWNPTQKFERFALAQEELDWPGWLSKVKCSGWVVEVPGFRKSESTLHPVTVAFF